MNFPPYNFRRNDDEVVEKNCKLDDGNIRCRREKKRQKVVNDGEKDAYYGSTNQVPSALNFSLTHSNVGGGSKLSSRSRNITHNLMA